MNVLRGLGRVGLAVFVFALCGAGRAVAQDGTISGTVTDQTSQSGLGQARVVLGGTNQFAITDATGEYTLRGVRPGTYELRVIRIGYASGTRSITVGAGETVTADFTLAPAVVSLDAIVVTAVGEQRAREVQNAISSVSAEEVLDAAPPTNFTDIINGRAPGVTILNSSGTVGVGSSIKIRGNSSISLSNTPLIYVDGVRIDNDNEEGPGVGGQDASRLNDINPADIERIEIVKGPAAATLYGTEAAAGVIQIFTKKGRSGAPVWSFRTDIGANAKSTYRFPDSFWNPQGFGFATDTIYSMNLLEQHDPFTTGGFQTFAGSVRGGTDEIQYYVSGEYQKEDGVLPNNGFDRYYARANFTIAPDEKWDLTLSNGYTSNFLRLPDNDNNGFGYIGVALIGFPWQDRITRADPNTGGTAIETCPLAYEVARDFGVPLDAVTAGAFGASLACQSNGGFFGNRPFDKVQTLTNAQDVERFTGSATFRLRPTPYWSNRLTLGYDLVAQRTGFLIPVDPSRPFGALSEGLRGLQSQTNRNLTVDYTGSLSFRLGEGINSTTSIGLQYYRSVVQFSECEGEVFPSGATTCSSAVTTTGQEDFIETKTLGFYVQEQVGLLNDRLFITPALRIDDNSAFGQNFDLATYPKVGVSYVALEQPWRQLDHLKLRAAWGRSGKQPGTFDALQRFATTKVAFRGSDVLGVSPANFGNPDLSPEIGEEWELGFDASLLDNRVGLEFTYYSQITRDAIVLKPLAPSLGFPQPVFTNIARVDNRGIEVGLNVTAIRRPRLSWDWGINLSTNSNEVKDLDEPIIFGLGGSSQRHAQGLPFASYVTEPVVFNSTTGAAEALEEQFVGQPTPKWEGSVMSSLTFARYFTLYAFMDFKGGHQLFNSTEEFRCGFLGGGDPRNVDDGGGLCPEMYAQDASGNYTPDAQVKQLAAGVASEGPWIEDADFAKLRTVSLKFTFPSTLARQLRISEGSVTLAAQNLATWTGYSGADPEINFAGQADATRAEFLTLPTHRRFTATFAFTF